MYYKVSCKYKVSLRSSAVLMLKYINIKKNIKNFSFTAAMSVAKIASKEVFCYGRNFFLTVT